MAANPISQAIRRSLAMGPSVRNLLNQYKLDPGQIASTGPHKTLLKSDVLAYINQKQPQSQSQSQSQPQPQPQQQQQNTKEQPKAQGNIIFRPEVNQGPLLNSRYARKYPTQLEIDVINSGGLND